jgi:hypothetical protein
MKRRLLAIMILVIVPVLGAAETVPIETGLSGNVSLELVSLTSSEPASPKGLPLSAPEPGFWRVIARAPGSAPAAFDLIPLIGPAELPPLRVVPARRISVRITDPAGRPLGGAAIRIDPEEILVDSWAPAPVEALAGQDGSVDLEVAPSIPLLLTAAAPGFVSERITIAPQITREIAVSLKPGMRRIVEVKDGQGKPVPEVAVTTAAGLRLGTTDQDGRLAVTVARERETELLLVAPDCRWARGALPSFVLEPPRTVRGQVVDRRTRQPLAGAWVWAEGFPSCSTRADKEGRYTVPVPGFGALRARAAAAGHRPESGDTLLALAPVETRRASGRVVDVQGRPVSGAEVLLTPSSASPESLAGIETLRRAALKAATDAQGRFQIDRLGQGPFDLQARARGFLPTRVRQVAIPPGRGNADLGVIALQTGTAFEGRVVDPGGNAVAGASVQAAPSSGVSPGDLPADGQASGREAVTDGDGAFSLTGFRDGDVVTLRVARKGYAARTISRIQTPLPEPLTVELTPSARIAGTVLDESGDPVAGARVVLTGEARFVAAAEVDSEGRFEMADLAPGRFRLSAVASGYLPAAHGGIEIKEGSGIEGIDLVLRRGAVVEGRVLAPDGSPVAGARVAVLDQPAETDLGLAGRPETFADDEGRYQLGGIAEGDRTVAAEHAGFRPARRQVKVQEGTTPLDLQLGRGFEVSGRVTSPEGPARGAFLRLLGVESASPVTSGPDGSFRFEAVAEGRYRVEAETPGYASAAEEVRVAGASVTGLEIRLERGGAIVGRILGLPFQDLAQVQVVATAPDRPGQKGQVDYGGRYRVEGLGPGEWKVIAALPAQSRQAGGVAALSEGRSEARLDLEFSAGFILSGRVERGGSPIGGALVLVESGDGSGGNTVTGPDGRFRVEGLRPGTYALTALEPRSNLRSDQKLEIEGDREVVVALPAPPGD